MVLIFSFGKFFPILIVCTMMFQIYQNQPTFSDNCANYNTTNSVCQQCNPGFYLQYFFCVTCNPNCLCSSKNDFCESCQILPFNGLNFHSYLQEKLNQCILCNSTMPYCLQCENLQICTKCFNGQYLVQQKDLNGVVVKQYCSENICTDNCQICQTNSTCKQCQPGFYLYPNKTCSQNQCTNNCTVCSSINSCLTCSQGYYLGSSSCLPCMQNCTSCTNVTYCEVCDPSMIFENGTCNNTGLSNCIQYADGGTVCTQCEPGYEVTAAACNPCTGCDICTEQFICLSPCLPGYKTFNFACIPNFSHDLWYSLSLMILLLFLIF